LNRAITLAAESLTPSGVGIEGEPDIPFARSVKPIPPDLREIEHIHAGQVPSVAIFKLNRNGES